MNTHEMLEIEVFFLLLKIRHTKLEIKVKKRKSPNFKMILFLKKNSLFILSSKPSPEVDKMHNLSFEKYYLIKTAGNEFRGEVL